MVGSNGDTPPPEAEGEANVGVAVRGAGGRDEHSDPGGRDGARTVGGVTDARVAAAHICADLRGGTLLDAAFDGRTARLDARDRRWTRELVYGMLRRRATLDAILNQRIRGGYARVDLDLLDLLRLGAYQLLHLNSVPAYAAIAQTVELAKRRHGIGASKLANAVLRRLDRERGTVDVPAPTDFVEALAVELSHPRWLVRRWVDRMGADDARQLMEANNEEAPLVARPVHVVREQLEAMLDTAGVRVEDVPLVRDSIRLAGPVSALTELGAFQKGLFHLQDAASTLVTLYASFAAGAVVADVCSAPGGKAIELARTAARVYAMDVSTGRLARVLQNIARMEIENITAIVADALHPALAPVDAVLVDAPCTGTGTFRRHPDARWRLKASDLTVLSALQREILQASASLVRPGGLLVYSTCSLEPEENDAQVNAFLRVHPDWTLEPPPAGTVPPDVLDEGLLRVLPHRHGSDGAFAARLRRPA